MRLVIALLPALCCGLIVGACDRQKDETPQGGGAPSGWSGPRGSGEGIATGRLDRSFAGTQMPTSSFESPDGDPVRLANFQGKPLLVNLWATWCAPCVAEMPTLDALAAREGDRLQILAVSQDMQGRDKVRAFFAEHDFSLLEPFLDPELALMSELKIDTLPTTILYNADGEEVWRMTGKENWTGERAAELLREADAG